MKKKFDLNIEKILDNWEIYHAIREIIANAIDETYLTGCKELEIYLSDNNILYIRDFGRGLRYQHLTQNENEEKLHHEGVIGKFGIGLKDALATLYRHNKKVTIRSRFGEISLGQSHKEGFEDITTLHAYISEIDNKHFEGTEFILEDIDTVDVEKAKSLFLRFSKEILVDNTKYGSVHKKYNSTGIIYVNGVKVAEEENFLFSYNITALNSAIKKALNRERDNVGRTAYADRIRSILMESTNEGLMKMLVEDFSRINNGDNHDELKWLDVQVHASKILNQMQEKVLFVTLEDTEKAPSIIDEARMSNYQIVTVPKNLRNKIQNNIDDKGKEIVDFNKYAIKKNSNYEYKFISIDELTNSEKNIFDKGLKVIESVFGNIPNCVKDIKISETMVKESYHFGDAVGVWERKNQRIIIKRTELKNIGSFTGTLLHELAHATSGAGDVTRGFEDELTDYLGKLAKALVAKTSKIGL